MDNLKRNWLRIVSIVVACLLLNTLLHLFVFPLILPTDFAPSIFVNKNIVPPVAGIGMLVTLGALAVVFALIQENLAGKRFVKGLWFGIAFTGLWVLGFIEISTLSDTIPMTEVINGLPDGITILLMSLLLGVYVAQDTFVEMNIDPKNQLVRVIVVAVAFFVGRYVAYWVFNTNSIFHPEPVEVFVWTFVMAIWIGVFYGILGNTSQRHPLKVRVLYFVGVIFGVDWFLYNLFLPIFLDVPILNMALRALLDLPFIATGILSSEYIQGSINRQSLV